MTFRAEAWVLVTLIAALVCAASGVIYFHGGRFDGGFPAAVAVCALGLMGIAAAYLILARL